MRKWLKWYRRKEEHSGEGLGTMCLRQDKPTWPCPCSALIEEIWGREETQLYYPSSFPHCNTDHTYDQKAPIRLSANWRGTSFPFSSLSTWTENTQIITTICYNLTMHFTEGAPLKAYFKMLLRLGLHLYMYIHSVTSICNLQNVSVTYYTLLIL